MIEVKHIDVELGNNGSKKRILSDISLSIEKGTITVLTGPSGSGKSTLLKSISLLINPCKGSVKIDDLSFSFPMNNNIRIRNHFKKNRNCQKMGIVFQDLHLIPHWTNYQNIIYPLKSITKEQKEKLNFFIELFDMEGFIYNFPNESSRGEEQRIALVRALMMEPEYLLLDEITSALDPEQAVNILKYCDTIRNLGTGILIITHYIPFAKKAADQVIFLDKGAIIEKGTNDILTNPETERMKSFIDSLTYIVGTEIK
ncbi:MAG: ATP-binding cassette domain-containing protein [Bacteroidales bacterium]|nr:ATP-binding cassette domain-containing protein [Bacteroidales bacterium]MCF8387969.1 ATP-binding cassette domain-containing protein [Bacteroidales bacterium]